MSKGRGSHCYAFRGRPKAEASNAMITGIVPAWHHPSYMLFDPDTIYFYVSTYFSLGFNFTCDIMTIFMF